jgi:hypothetical protein
LWINIGTNLRAFAEWVLIGSLLMGAGMSFFLSLSQAAGNSMATVETVSVTHSSNSIEVEIAASYSVTVRRLVDQS